MQAHKFFINLLLVCIFGLAAPATTEAQVKKDSTQKIIQFSGIAVDADSLTPLPFVAVIIHNSQRGVYSNINGY